MTTKLELEARKKNSNQNFSDRMSQHFLEWKFLAFFDAVAVTVAVAFDLGVAGGVVVSAVVTVDLSVPIAVDLGLVVAGMALLLSLLLLL